MNNQDYIRKAVGLADGYDVGLSTDEGCWIVPPHGKRDEWHSSWQWVQDAVAAQLVRQVGITGAHVVVGDGTAIRIGSRLVGVSEGPDRTINTIRAIVDSKVLEQ